MKNPLLRRSCRHHLLPAFSTLPTGPAISSGCKQVEKPHLSVASAVSWDGRAGKLHSRAELPCGVQQCCCWPCFVAAVMEVLGSLQKAMLLEKKKSSTKAWLPGKPWSGSLLVAAQARAASSDAGQAALPLLPTSTALLLPVPPNSPSRTLQLLLAGSRAPYMSVHEIARAAQAGQQQHMAMILYCVFHHLICTGLGTGAADQHPDLETHHKCGSKGHAMNPTLPVPSFLSPAREVRLLQTSLRLSLRPCGQLGPLHQAKSHQGQLGHGARGGKELHAEWCKGGGRAPSSQRSAYKWKGSWESARLRGQRTCKRQTGLQKKP